MEFDFEDITRRSWRNRARAEFRFEYETNCILRRSRKLPVSERTQELNFEIEGLEPPELFDDGTEIIAAGGYVKTPVEAEYQLELSSRLNTASVTGKTSSNKWEDVGVHIELDGDSISSAGYSVSASLRLKGVSKTLEQFQLYGLNVAPVTFQYFRENIQYDDESVGERFRDSVASGIYSHQLYYLDHAEPLPIEPNEISRDDFEQGEVVVLRQCSRKGRFLPIEFELSKSNERNFKISYSTHCNDGCNHGDNTFPMVNKFPVSLDQSTVSIQELPNALADLIVEEDSNQASIADFSGDEKTSPDLIFDSHFGYQAECRACKKFEVNDEGNPKRTTAQHNEAKDKRSVKEYIAYKQLGESPYDQKFNRNHDQTFRHYVWEQFDRKCFNCGKSLSNPNSDNSSMHLDHTRPSAKFYPLDKHATCLCNDCNRDKGERYPSNYYRDPKLDDLVKITGIDPSNLLVEKPNTDVLKSLIENPENLFEDYLNHRVCQKEYSGVLIADKIVSDINDLLEEAEMSVRIEDAYQTKTGNDPEKAYKDN